MCACVDECVCHCVKRYIVTCRVRIGVAFARSLLCRTMQSPQSATREYPWRGLRDKINRRRTDRQQVDEGAATTPRLGHISHHCAERVQQLRLHSRFQNHQVHVHLERDNK